MQQVMAGLAERVMLSMAPRIASASVVRRSGYPNLAMWPETMMCRGILHAIDYERRVTVVFRLQVPG